MKDLVKVVVLVIVINSCNPLGRPREIDWKKEWNKSGQELKILTQEIKENKGGRYQMGNNDFPGSFDYPFDEGFFIGYESHDTLIDTTKISIRYYVDRGLLDHFSAFIYTKNSSEIRELDIKVRQGANDYKIEDNWYMIND